MKHVFSTGGPSGRPSVYISTTLLALVLLSALACDDKKEGTTGVTSQRTESTYAATPPTPPTLPTPQAVTQPTTMSDAVEELEAVEVVPREVTFEEAESVFREKRYDEAQDLFALYTERHPKNVWGEYMLGLSAWKAGDFYEAEQAFTRALEIEPAHEKSLINMARVLLDQGRPEDALVRIESARELDPEAGSVHRMLGRALYQLGDEESSIESYRQAIVIDDQDTWSMNNLGLIYIKQERFEDALLPLARATELDDGVVVFLNNLGTALERTGHFAASRETFKAALAIDDSYDKAAVSLARVEEREAEREPVDLFALSLSFQEEIGRWRQSVVAEIDPTESDSTVVGIVEITSLQPDDEIGGEGQKN
ncbi:MAG: tetratricopeptide repeat protein [Gemmatimonadota bacterium]